MRHEDFIKDVQSRVAKNSKKAQEAIGPETAYEMIKDHAAGLLGDLLFKHAEDALTDIDFDAVFTITGKMGKMGDEILVDLGFEDGSFMED